MQSELKECNTLPAEVQRQADSCSQGEIRDALICFAVKVPVPSVHAPEVVVAHIGLQYIETVIIRGF